MYRMVTIHGRLDILAVRPTLRTVLGHETFSPDIQALWRSALSVIVPECQKLKT